MTSNYVQYLENFCAWKLHCSTENLEELSKIFSKLAKSVNFELKEDDKYLEDVLYRLLRTIAVQVHDYIYNICENSEIVEYVDTDNNNIKMYKVEGCLKDSLIKIAEKIVEADPFILSDSYGTSFDSVLDKVIDYDSDIECNIDYLISYLLKNNLVEVGEEYKEE